MKTFPACKHFLFAATFFFIFVHSSLAQVDSVFYHDGTFESQYGASGASPSVDFYRYATRFTPPYYPAQLVGIKAWFRNAANPSSFKFVVYLDSTGAASGPLAAQDYISPVEINNPSSTGVPDSSYSSFVDITAENIFLNAGDVYAGVTQHPISNGFVGIAIDDTNAYTTDRPWAYYGSWTQMINWAFVNGEWGITAYFIPVSNGIKNEIRNNNTSVVYPNPAHDKLFIARNPATADEMEIGIYNITGQKIFLKTISENQKQSMLDVSTLSPGLYFVRCHTASFDDMKYFIKN